MVTRANDRDLSYTQTHAASLKWALQGNSVQACPKHGWNVKHALRWDRTKARSGSDRGVLTWNSVLSLQQYVFFTSIYSAVQVVASSLIFVWLLLIVRKAAVSETQSKFSPKFWLCLSVSSRGVFISIHPDIQVCKRLASTNEIFLGINSKMLRVCEH